MSIPLVRSREGLVTVRSEASVLRVRVERSLLRVTFIEMFPQRSFHMAKEMQSQTVLT